MVSNIVPFEIIDLKRADFSRLKYFYAEAYTLFPQIILNFCFLRTLPSEWHASKDVDRNRTLCVIFMGNRESNKSIIVCLNVFIFAEPKLMRYTCLTPKPEP